MLNVLLILLSTASFLSLSANELAAAKVAAVVEVATATPIEPIAPPTAFAAGETLEYDLVWNRITAGTMTIRILPLVELDGQKAWKFVMNVKTSGIADNIYKVRINILSYLTNDLSCSLKYYADKVEGSRKKIQLFTYDWDKMKVHYKKNRTEDRGWRDLQAKSFDPLGMFFAIRNMIIDDTTEELTVWVSDGKKNTKSTAKIVRKETLEVNGKRYNTFLVEPDLKDLKGVFSKSKNAKLQLWVTDDKYHIPVKITSKVTVGSFTAELTKHVKTN